MDIGHIKKAVKEDIDMISKHFISVSKLKNSVVSLFKAKNTEYKSDFDTLKDTALRKLSRLEKKSLTQNVFDDFVWIMKVFLSNHLKIGYEFTHQELVEELRKRKVKYKGDIIRLSEEILEVNYEGREISKEEFKKMIGEARSIICNS